MHRDIIISCHNLQLNLLLLHIQLPYPTLPYPCSIRCKSHMHTPILTPHKWLRFCMFKPCFYYPQPIYQLYQGPVSVLRKHCLLPPHCAFIVSKNCKKQRGQSALALLMKLMRMIFRIYNYNEIAQFDSRFLVYSGTMPPPDY
jgi:hypothetical protein